MQDNTDSSSYIMDSSSSSSPLPTGDPSSSCQGFLPGDTVRVTSTFVAYAQSLAGMASPKKTRLTENAVLRVAQALRSGPGSEEGYILELGADDVFDSKNKTKNTKVDNNDNDNNNNPWRRRGKFLVCTRDEAERYLEPLETTTSSSPASPPTVDGNAPYQDIVAALETSERIFPQDIARHAASFLTVENVVPDEITACDCSSTRGDYPLSTTLAEPTSDDESSDDDEYEPSTYWISGAGSMVCGTGEQFIEYKLSPTSTIRRCSYVGVSIPVLPQGPLSVRRFRVDSSLDGGKTWRKGSKIFETMDMPGMQAFKLPEAIDADRVRLVCLQNAWADMHKNGRSYFESVGLYRVGFQ